MLDGLGEWLRACSGAENSHLSASFLMGFSHHYEEMVQSSPPTSPENASLTLILKCKLFLSHSAQCFTSRYSNSTFCRLLE